MAKKKTYFSKKKYIPKNNQHRTVRNQHSMMNL